MEQAKDLNNQPEILQFTYSRAFKHCQFVDVLKLDHQDIPISTNDLWIGTVSKGNSKKGYRYGQISRAPTSKYKAFQNYLVPLAKNRAEEQQWLTDPNDRYAVIITLHLANKRVLDVDNRTKSLLDCLTKAQVFHDDSKILSLTVRKHETETSSKDEEFTSVEVYKFSFDEKAEKEELKAIKQQEKAQAKEQSKEQAKEQPQDNQEEPQKTGAAFHQSNDNPLSNTFAQAQEKRALKAYKNASKAFTKTKAKNKKAKATIEQLIQKQILSKILNNAKAK